MKKELIIKLMLAKFPEMKKYVHLLNWTETDDGDIIGIPSSIPQPLNGELDKWFNELQR